MFYIDIIIQARKNKIMLIYIYKILPTYTYILGSKFDYKLEVGSNNIVVLS